MYKMNKIEKACQIIGVDTFTLFQLAFEWFRKKSDPECARLFHNGYLNGSRPPNFVLNYCDAVIEKDKEPDWPARLVPIR